MKIRKLMISMVTLAASCSCMLLSGCKSNEQISAEASASISPTAEATTAAPSPDSTTLYEAGATWTPTPSPEATLGTMISDDSAAITATSTPTTDTYKAGTLSDKEYKSTYIGLQFKASKDYVLATKEQLKQAFGQGAKIAYGDKSDEVQALTKDMVTYEMMAAGKTGYPNVSIGVEKATIDSMTEAQYFEAFKTQLSSLGTVKATVGDSVTETLCGQSYLVAPVTMKVNSVEVTEKVYIRKKENNFIFITLTGLKGKENDMNALMKQFSACK
ncbi:MAG: hypothetical protein Q4G58_05270 [bacterium]|nr:hypothetical protein [bacterium]